MLPGNQSLALLPLELAMPFTAIQYHEYHVNMKNILWIDMYS